MLNFNASAISEFKDSLIVSARDPLILPVSVIYGHNGGGKSNALQALACLINIIISPIQMLEKNKIHTIIQSQVNCRPFRFDSQSYEKSTVFNILLRLDSYDYRYCLAVKKGQIEREYLCRKSVIGKRTATVFDRMCSQIILGSSISRSGINVDVAQYMPFLSYLYIKYDIPDVYEVVRWFELCITQTNHTERFISEAMVSCASQYKDQTICMFRNMDINIKDYRYDSQEHQFYIKRIINHKLCENPLSEESDGLQKLFFVLPMVIMALNENRLIVIDDLDALIHPLLLKHLILLFKDKCTNPYGAQLLFTSHDTATIKNIVFRRDEIKFAVCSENYESKLYSLIDIHNANGIVINNTAAYDKQYLEGRYGAIPNVKNNK